MCLCICPSVVLYVFFCAFDSLWVLPQAFFFPGKRPFPDLGTCPNCKIYVFCGILSIFLAVGIAAGAFFPGKRPFPDFGDMPHWRKHCFSVVLCIWGPLGHLWSPFGSLWGGLGSLWGAIGLPLGCPWLALGALGSLWVPLAPFGCPWAPFGSSMFTVCDACAQNQASWNSSRMSRMSRMWRKWCHPLLLRPPLPHAPGARMT